MNWGRVSRDSSTCMLFESSGDSEVERVDVSIGDPPEAEPENDALSCSDGSSPDCADVQLEVDAADGGGFNSEDYDNVGGGFGRQQDDRGEHRDGDSDEEDGVVDQCFGGRTVVAPHEDLVREPKGEMEDPRVVRESDRLFWEACLQS